MSVSTFLKALMAFIATFIITLPVATKPIPAVTEHYKPESHFSALASWIVENNRTVNHSKAHAIVEEAYKAGAKYKIDPILILSVIQAESNFRDKAKNPSGASGLMQVIPKWHKDKIAGRDIFDYRVNIDVGARIINEYLISSKEDYRKAMRRYSGGGSTKYQNRILKAHTEMKSAVLAWRLDNNKPIVATYVLHKPRLYSETVSEHFAQAAERQEQKFFESFLVASN